MPDDRADASTSSRRHSAWRPLWLVVHRYLGLTIATFLVVVGLTGSLLAFYPELEALCNPRLMVVERPAPDAPMLDPLDLRARILAQVPQWPGHTVNLTHEPGRGLVYWYEVGEEQWRGIYADPYTGRVLGQRDDSTLTWGNLPPLIYRLHYELELGAVGLWLLGIVALLWTIDCLVGLYLTLPASRATARADTGDGDRRSWWGRWKPSWLVQGGSLFAGVFSFHRAGGLWAWPLLLVFAWSSVGFNLGPVYRPVMGLLGNGPDVWASLPALETPRERHALAWPDAIARARTLMAEQASARGFTVGRESVIEYVPHHGLFQYTVHSSLDVSARRPGTRLWFDGDDGAVRGFHAPTGIAAGDTVTSWLNALHMADIGGLPYRILVCLVGVLIVLLSVTGIWIWWHKLRIRRRARRRDAIPSAAPADPDVTA